MTPHASRSSFWQAGYGWIAFVLVQFGDGILTVAGVRTLGLEMEANPIIGWYAAAFGPVAALGGAKAAAIGCGAVLHLYAYHRTIAVLTLLYVLAAIVPWLVVLTSLS